MHLHVADQQGLAAVDKDASPPGSALPHQHGPELGMGGLFISATSVVLAMQPCKTGLSFLILSNSEEIQLFPVLGRLVFCTSI